MNYMKFVSLPILFLISYLAKYEAYKILAIYPFEGRSHFIFFRALNIALAKAGHQVDVISHFPLEKSMKNYRDIVNLDGSRFHFTGNVTVQSAQELGANVLPALTQYFGNDLCELMGHEKMREFMDNLDKIGPYDAVIVEVFGADCYAAFGHYWKVPIIAVSSTSVPTWINHAMRNPANLAIHAHSFFEKAYSFEPQYFWSRLQNTYSHLKFVNNFFHLTDIQNDIIRKYLGPGVPDIRTLESNIALTLINTHYSVFGVRPFLASMVEVAGLHVLEDDAKLSTELRKWMDDSKHGVVYFSLGSLITIETLSKEVLTIFLNSFAKISPIRVLMKISKSEILNEKNIQFPANVKILRWIPQIPVLKHRNTKVFITHGGVMGSIEALHYGVPMIGIPFFGDQPANVNLFSSKNLTFSISFDHLIEKILDSALNAILYNSKYKVAVKEASRVFQDRPLNASATAIYWIEYVIRNGENSLRSPATKLYWWQYELLDIYLFTFAIVFLLIYLCYRVFGRCFKTRSYTKKKLQ